MPDIVQGFLDDIVAHPEDASLWLILADWLEDQDDPRAELVRLTWALQYEPDHADFAARQSRLQSLLAGGMVPVRPRVTVGGIEFAWIPPGTFLMGSPETEEERCNDEKQHRVTLTKGLYLGVYPVTQTEWQAVMGSNPSYHKGARRPVENVSWDDCQEFCEKLREGLNLPIRLPSEAEWEYACRAGTTTPFYFGRVLNGHQANCDGGHPYGTSTEGPHLGETTEVGQYPANAWGLYDTVGNVWEWCQDVYGGDYESLTAVDSLNEQPLNGRRVLRGGSFDDGSGYCRAALRHWHAPGDRNGIIGFRVCFRPD